MQNRMGGGTLHAGGQRQAVQGQGQGQYPQALPTGAPAEIDIRAQQRQHQQQMDRDRDGNSLSQQQLQHQRQQQLSEMQHNLMLRQMQMNGGRPQQSIMSHPHGHIHASNSHAHTQYAPLQPFSQSTFYQQQGAQHSHSGHGQRAGSGMQSKVHIQHMYPISEEEEGSSRAKVVSASNSAEVQSHLGKFMGDIAYNAAGGGGALSGGLSLYNPDGSHSNPPIPQGRGYVGAYSPEARRARIERFLAKRDKRVWTKKVKYDVRKNFADSRLRVKVSRSTWEKERRDDVNRDEHKQSRAIVHGVSSRASCNSTSFLSL
jgi:CCT motif